MKIFQQIFLTQIVLQRFLPPLGKLILWLVGDGEVLSMVIMQTIDQILLSCSIHEMLELIRQVFLSFLSILHREIGLGASFSVVFRIRVPFAHIRIEN